MYVRGCGFLRGWCYAREEGEETEEYIAGNIERNGSHCQSGRRTRRASRNDAHWRRILCTIPLPLSILPVILPLQ